MHIIQDIIDLNMHLHRGSDHASKKLCDIGCVICVFEGHHGLCPWAIPACGQIFFKEDNTDIPIIRDTGRLLITYFKPIYRKGGSCSSESVNYLTAFQLEACPLLNLCDAIIQIGIGQFTAGSIQNLNDQNWIHIGIMLLKTILRPVFPLFLPIVCCRLQDSHIVVDCAGLRVSDNNAVF